MMRLTKITCAFFSIATLFAITSCDDSKSYADMLKDEEKAISNFLKGVQVIERAPTTDEILAATEADSTKYYAVGDGAYIAILNHGDLEVKAQKGYNVYARLERINLLKSTTLWTDVDWGNTDGNYIVIGYQVEINSDYGSQPYYPFGQFIEMPLIYVGEGAVVRLLTPSKLGPTEEQSAVTPFLYQIQYSKIFNAPTEK